MRIIRRSTLVFYLVLAIIIGGGVAVVGAQTVAQGAWLGLVPVLIIAWLGLRGAIRRWLAARRSLSEAERQWLVDHLPFYAALGARFERDAQFFLAEQTFEGLDGVAVTDTLKLAVAAGAALMLHGRPDWEFPANRTILFYPGHFDDDYYDSDYATYDGMVHAQGPVILSAPAVQQDWAHPGTGHNVVLHELAHLFDFDDAVAEGTPTLMDPKSAAAWQQLVRQEKRRVRLGRSLLRGYAATNSAEFFAVAVESFFDRPEALRQRHARLFDALVAFFDLDPRTGSRRELNVE